MILNNYIRVEKVILIEKNTSGYFIERFLYFNYQKNNNFKVTDRFNCYNSNKINYFYALLQCFFRVKLEKLKYLKNLISRINLLKLRFEVPRFDSIQLFKFNKNLRKLKKKTYGSLNNITIIPQKISFCSNDKIKVLLKKLFFNKNFKTTFFFWFFFFGKLNKVIRKINSELTILNWNFHLDIAKLLDKGRINKLISNSKNLSWVTGIINLLHYKRLVYHKRNTTLYIRTGLLRLSKFSFSGYLMVLNSKTKIETFLKFKIPVSFSIDPIFSQINKSICFYTPKLFSEGLYGFRVLASKKKLPLKIYTPFSADLDIYNCISKELLFKLSIRKILPRYVGSYYLDIKHKTSSPLSNCETKLLNQTLNKKNLIFNQLIIKEANDFNNELGAIYLLSQFEKILREYQIDIWLNPLSFNSYYFSGGTIEVIPNSSSIHEIKSHDGFKKFKIERKSNIKDKKQLIRNFSESLAGYSLFCYLLQIKDRHNANILFNQDNRIIHVDFAFILGSLPGNLKLEATTFKLSEYFLLELKGEETQSFDNLREIFTRGFLILRKNLGKVVNISKSLILEEQLKNKNKNKSQSLELIKRFELKFKNGKSIRYCHKLFKESLEDWRTKQYDKYQMLASGIKI